MATANNMQVINWDIARQKLKQREQAILYPPEWIDIKTICSRYNTSRSTVFRLRKAGSFPEPSTFLGDGSQRWNAEEIDKLMEARKGRKQ